MAPETNVAAFARVRRESPTTRHLVWLVVSIVSGLIAPAIMVLVGVIAWFLMNQQLPAEGVPLGRYLTIPIPASLATMRPVAQLMALISFGVILAAIESLTIWLAYRGILQRAGEAIDKLHMRVLQGMVDRAQEEGVAAQRLKAEQLIDKTLPQLRSGLIAWWRAVPRSFVLLLGCSLIAVMIDPWLSLLAGLSGALVWRLVLWMRDDDEDQVSTWELPESRRQLMDLLQHAPLLARIQPASSIDHRFNDQLKNLRNLHQRIELPWARMIPLLGFAVSIAIGVLALVLGASLLDRSTGLNVSAAMVLVLCVAGSVAASARLLFLYRELGPARIASANLYSFLDYYPGQPSSVLVGLPAVREQVRFDRVSLRDGLGQPLLNQITLEFHPGEVIALMGVESVGLQALVEMLMGYGRPTTGRLTFDGIDVSEIHPNSLAKQVIWVSSDGPLWSGTVVENIRAGSDATIDRIVSVCRSFGLYEYIQSLPDGLNTVISPGDSQLPTPVNYAIGLARAIVKQPAVVVLQEPSRVASEAADDLAGAGLQQLANTGSIVVVLPRRISTLRNADRVILVHHGKVEVEGKHQQLLESNDLYRHLNYLLFNPYRQLSNFTMRS